MAAIFRNRTSFIHCFFFKLWLLFSVCLQILKTISLGQRALHRVGMVMTFVFSNGEKQLCCCKAEFYVLELYIDIKKKKNQN